MTAITSSIDLARSETHTVAAFIQSPKKANMEVDNPSFELRCELKGHLEDVRGVRDSPFGVLTSSRDKLVKVWAEEASANCYTCINTLVGHTDYVGPLLYLPPGAGGGEGEQSQGSVASGSRDKSIIVWDPTTASALRTLTGHAWQVTALALTSSGEIVSASLDKTLRIWRGSKCSAVLEGHEGPVLSVIVLPNGQIVSGSGDSTIKIWDGVMCMETLRKHTDTVRGLAVLPDIGFVSGSHDMSCIVWTSTGDVLGTLLGHTALIYAVAAVSGGLIASGSEDNTARIWRAGGECLATIDHPGCVWDVAGTAAGELVTGCADAIARIWTSKDEQKAPAEVLTAYKANVASFKAGKAAGEAAGKDAAGPADAGTGGLPPGVKAEEPHALAVPGVKSGQNKFIRQPTGAITLYCWDAAAFTWEEVGEVLSGAEAAAAAGAGGGGGSGGGGTIQHKKFHGGREWDFVFDVDIAEGQPPLKLAMNADDNPYIVADNFLQDNDLPIGYKDQIVKFILQNTADAIKKGAMPSNAPITGGGCDPFTGGGRAESRPSGLQQGSSSNAAYGSSSITGGGVDPFTGDSRGGASSSSGPPPHTLRHLPLHAFLAFDNVPNTEALGRKLREFNALVAQANSSAALSEEELAPSLDKLLSKLPPACAAMPPDNKPSSLFDAADVALLAKLLTWPAPQLFPALDIARVVVLDGAGSRLLGAQAGRLTSSAAEPSTGLLGSALAVAASAPSITANQQLALRLVANCFKHEPLRAWALSQRSEVLERFSSSITSQAKPVRLSFATLLANYSAALRRAGSGADEEGKLQVLSAAAELLTSCSAAEDPDSVFRALQAVGTVVAGNSELCELAQDLGVTNVMAAIQAQSNIQSRVLEAGIDVMATLKAGRK